MALVPQSAFPHSNALASDNLRSSSSSITGVPLRLLGKPRLFSPKRRDVSVSALFSRKPRRKHKYPWPPGDVDLNVKGGVLTHLSYFKPLTEKPKPFFLPFEKELAKHRKTIEFLKKEAEKSGVDVEDYLQSLEENYRERLRNIYSGLSPIQRVSVARHPHRPTFLDHVFNITEKFVELHGDRAGYDDPAIVTGLGSINGRSYLFIGHQKGRNTKENIKRNFGMPTPHGYRKALRMMHYADHHGFPIISFIDTPGAFADIKSEELGQGEAIAQNLRTMFGLKVPIVTIVIGEGGSGGALAIGCANKLLMLENAVFYVASPEACAAILYKKGHASPMASAKLKITAEELARLQIADGVIPEPCGGAHADPEWTSQQIKKAVVEAMDELMEMDTQELLLHRQEKFRKLGGVSDAVPIDPKRKRMMKALALEQEANREFWKLADQVRAFEEAQETSRKISKERLMRIEKLKTVVRRELSRAYEALGMNERRMALMKEIAKARSSEDQLAQQAVHERMKDLKKELEQRLPSAPNYANLKKASDMLKKLSKAEKPEAKKKQTSEIITYSPNEMMVRKLEEEYEKELTPALNAVAMDGIMMSLKSMAAGARSQKEFNDMLETARRWGKIFGHRLRVLPNYYKLKKQSDVLKVAKASRKAEHQSEEVGKKLKKEVGDEYSRAFEALGMSRKRAVLLKEISEARKSSDDGKIVDRGLLDKMERFKEEFKKRLPSASNYASLNKKIDMLKQVSKAKKISETSIKSAYLTGEIDKRMKEIRSQPHIREKVESIKAEIDRSGARSVEDLEDEKKERILAVKKEIESEFVKALKTLDLKVQAVKSRGGGSRGGGGRGGKSSLDRNMKRKIKELDGEIRRIIEKTVNSPEVKQMMGALKSEAEKAGGKKAGPELGGKIQGVKDYIRESVEKNFSSSEMVKQLEKEYGREKSRKMVSEKVGAAVGRQ